MLTKVLTMPASPESLKVDVLMGMDPPKSPVMLLMVIPPSMNQVVSNALRTSRRKALTLACPSPSISVSNPKGMELWPRLPVLRWRPKFPKMARNLASEMGRKYLRPPNRFVV